jgi:hypothetical protein
MPSLTKKFDYEKAKRNRNVWKPDYQERIREERGEVDRGRKSEARIISFRGHSLVMNLRSFYDDDKKSMLQTLEKHWKFIINGQVGTIGQLRKNPKVAKEVNELFVIIQRSILRADEVIEITEHPKTKRKFPVLEFRCNICPVEPFPNPFFKKHLAFSAKLVGPATK